MQHPDKGRHMYDKENHEETSSGRIRRPSEKQRQLERAREHLHQLANNGSENEGTQEDDDDERHVVDDDHDNNNSGDTQFSNRVVRTELGSGTKQPLAFRNNKVPRTPWISASMIEAIEALMSSDRETEDESGEGLTDRDLGDLPEVSCGERRGGQFDPRGLELLGRESMSREKRLGNVP
ncbi:hypothetical protein EDD15DRAFT_2379391 [Pisolithus albus]|nr:hypothetical protein EDD15DRAFT_2379391 [Pisolithus albus]